MPKATNQPLIFQFDVETEKGLEYVKENFDFDESIIEVIDCG